MNDIFKKYVEYVFGKPNPKKCLLCGCEFKESINGYCSDQCLETDKMVLRADCEGD